MTESRTPTASSSLTARATGRLKTSVRAHPYAYALGLLCLLLVVLALWYGGRSYFKWDEWNYWTRRRDLLNASLQRPFLFEPYHGTFPTGIMVLWYPLDVVFGMHTYLPYVLPSVLFHVVAAVAMFALIGTSTRRGIALGAAASFLFMGNAAYALSYGWAVSFVGSLAATFVALAVMLTEKPGRESRTISITVVAVVAAVLFSAVGISTVAVIVVGYIALRRPGVAAFHAILGGVLVLGWRAAYNPAGVLFRFDEIGTYASFVTKGLIRAGADLVQLPFAVGALVLIAAGFGAVWSYRVRDRLWVANVALLTGALVFYVITGIRGSELLPVWYSFDQDRYLYVAAAFLLPSLAWLVDRVLRSRSGAVIAMVVLVWTVGANVEHQLGPFQDAVDLGQANRSTIATAASLEARLDSLQHGSLLVADRSMRFTVEQFRTLIDQGKVPCLVDHEAALTLAAGQGLGPIQPEDVVCP